MHVRQHVVLDAADLKRLTSGKPLTLMLADTVIDLSLGLDERARPLAGVNHAPPAMTLTRQRGDCPYCERKDVLIASHVKNVHTGKPVPWIGPGGIACPVCRRKFPSKRSLAIHAIFHAKKRGPGRPKKTTTEGAKA